MKPRAMFKNGIGELPAAMPTRDGFSIRKWLSRQKPELSAVTHSTAKGYRMRHAAILLRKINAGALAPEAVAGIERDYRRELVKLRKGAK